ncbi:MAG: hypothetical protein ACRDIB_06845 [Ardenticatenaceae bacterium]
MRDEKRKREATIIGLLLLGAGLCCCVVTVAGWVIGTFRALG